MTEERGKRKALNQLSPYSNDLIDDDYANKQADNETAEPKKPFKRAKARKGQTADQQALRGIFGNVSLAPESRLSLSNNPEPIPNYNRNEMMAGLNKSLLNSIKVILEKQANKDLRSLFDQYKKYLQDIEDNEK